MKTETFCGIYYLCPDCQYPNTIRVNLEHNNIPCGKCRKCKARYSFGEIEFHYFKVYGFLKTPFDVVNYFACEFICDDCGSTTTILPDDCTVTYREHENGMTIRTMRPSYDGKDTPDKGICSCGKEYELTFPTPQVNM